MEIIGGFMYALGKQFDEIFLPQPRHLHGAMCCSYSACRQVTRNKLLREMATLCLFCSVLI